MSQGHLYHYISSKDDILFLINKNVEDIWYEQLVGSGYEDEKDPLARLCTAVRQTIKFIRQHRKLINLIFNESRFLKREYLMDFKAMYNRNVVGFWYQILKQVDMQNPVKRDLKIAAKLLPYTLSFVAQRGWGIEEMDSGEIEDFLAGYVLEGLGLPPGRNR